MTEQQTKEQRDEQIRLAQRAFDAHGSFYSQVNGHMLELSMLAMKAPALVAAGGIAALLAFYSANWKALNEIEGSVATFNSILFYMFISLVCSMIAPALAYFCTASIGSARYSEKFSYEWPYISKTRATQIYDVIAEILRWLAVIAVLGSIVCICIGGWKFLDFIEPFTKPL